ncbi:hybrid sensor histidine kinase/response regulator transcription factor [Rufibacter latericius]|uniref:histidine kinase n=1 Tax=Rufibacter latericius TaxID=2487040 RepID=A0A3M9MJ67_9BACT|nr:two-component regulator propeller domain-containing protein [Rufibacter latericius]RNI25620.1 hybrid sensor histidine kinase/response regulator [Rufibacter latericius]
MLRFLLLFFLASLSWENSAYGQPAEGRFYAVHQLDSRNGLSNSCVNAIFQDSDDLLWIGTYDGLNVYDGSSFHIFNYHQKGSGKSIGNNVITYISEDAAKNIWVETSEGISRYSKQTGEFYNYFYENGRQVDVQVLAISSQHGVFCLIQEKEKTVGKRFNPTTKAFEPFNFPFPVANVSDFAFDAQGKLWVLNQDRVEVYSPQNQTFLKEHTIPIKAEKLFVLREKVYFQETGTHTLREISPVTLQTKTVALFPEPIKALAHTPFGFQVAWASGGVGSFDHRFQLMGDVGKELNLLQNVSATSFWASKDQTLWVGTDGNGILKIAPNHRLFHSISELPNGVPFKAVRAFAEVGEELWVGTKGNGILRFKYAPNRTQLETEPLSYSAPQQLENNAVYAIQPGKEGLVYLGTDGLGITLYDPQTKTFLKWKEVEGSDHYPTFASVYAVLPDQDSSVWLATSGYGLVHLKLRALGLGKWAVQYLERFMFHGDGTGPASNVIFSLMEGKDHHLWLGCRNGGLSLFDKITRKFRHFKAFSVAEGLSHNDVLSLYKDRQNYLWIGTSYGLNWVKESDALLHKVIFRKLTTEEGLPNNSIHGITEDGKGNIWVSTNNGLARINPSSLQIDRFQAEDGLQGNEFSDGAVWKNAQGMLFFGGIYGFNYVNPEEIQYSNRQVNLLVSDLQLGSKIYRSAYGQLVLRPGQSQKAENFTVPRREGFFDVRLKAIDFQKSEKSQYAYMLEGADQTWVYSGTNGRISYRNLAPGTYTFKVKWTNGEGQWTPEAVLFRVTVDQYLWLSWQAFLFYFVVAVVVIYAYSSYRRSRLEMRNQLDLEHRLRLKDEEVHQEQLSFFTNIAHELQTPLTLITGSLERYLQKRGPQTKTGDSAYFLSLVQQHTSRLHYLVNQILEFRKAQEGHLKVHYSYVNVSALLANIAELFKPLQEQKKLRFTSHISPAILGWTDKDKLEKIVFNLLSNAFKHSESNQEVILTVTENAATHQVQITVANSGSNLSPEQLRKLFDRFFVLDSTQKSKFSFGIGLAFTQEMVSLLNGQITVQSADDWVTFTATLPISAIPGVTGLTRDNVLQDKPSPLLHAATHQPRKQNGQPTSQNNKRALLQSLDPSHKPMVLLVEDEADIRYLLRDLLEEEFLIFEAENGQQALELLAKTLPDLIISDIMMPEMDGLELCARLKNTPETCHIPVVLLTARGTLEEKVEGYDAGADAYIPKPFHTAHLLVRVRKLLEYKNRLHQLFQKDSFILSLEEDQLENTDKEFLSKALQRIEAHLDNPDLNAALLEKELMLSKMQLYRKLKALSAMTPAEFIKHVRLQKAAALLQNTNLSVSEIFYQTGFNNQSYFFREFKKRYECSPNEYRSHHRIQA